MGSAVEKLVALTAAENRHNFAPAELLATQIEAANERLQSRLGQIPLLTHRAEEAGLNAVREAGDLAPLLFSHTAYKSYPESWLTQGKWDRLAQWLNTVSAATIEGVDNNNVSDIDMWLDRLAAAGHFVSCSSGTTGKCSMIVAAMADRAASKRNSVAALQWATGIAPHKDFKMIGATPVASSFRNRDSKDAINKAFGDGDEYLFPGEPITVGQISQMVALRRRIGEGAARPAEIAAFEATSAARQAAMQQGLSATAEAIVSRRGEKLFITGMFATLFQIAEQVRALGFSGKDFRADNALLVGGGLKGASLPPDYRERILATFNIDAKRVFQYYGMQELNTTMPRCQAGRYHVPPWVMLLLLDQGGDKLIEPGDGEVEGRAGFFDLSIEGRWGGVISGDRIQARYGKCGCGHPGPTVGADIVRYADLPGGDKISCAGTIDAYVRGVA